MFFINPSPCAGTCVRTELAVLVLLTAIPASVYTREITDVLGRFVLTQIDVYLYTCK